MNQIYFEDKKVIEQIEMTTNTNESLMEEEVSTLSVQSKEEKDVYRTIANKH
jgi:hypothetical protein